MSFADSLKNAMQDSKKISTFSLDEATPVVASELDDISTYSDSWTRDNNYKMKKIFH